MAVSVLYLTLGVSWLVTAVLVVFAAGFLVRTFVVFHDCAHGSLFASRCANRWVGRLAGLFVLSPFARWRHDHAVHHATSGDLERRGIGDIVTLTVAEYRSRPLLGRLAYRAVRNPLVMFGCGPIVAIDRGAAYRDSGSTTAAAPQRAWHRCGADLGVALLCLLVGWERFLLVWGPPAMLAGSVEIWLFYVQHQFEDAYWQGPGEWSYADAALRGSSYLRLPRPL